MNVLIRWDTHKAIKTLIKKGLTEEQAEGIIEVQQDAMLNNLATKDDIDELKTLISNNTLKIKETNLKIEQTNLKIEELRKDTKKDLLILEYKLILKLGLIIVATIGLFTQIDKILG